MRRSNLETVFLMCKKFGLESPHDLLRDCMDCPKLSGIKRAVATLKEVHSLQSLKSHVSVSFCRSNKLCDLMFFFLAAGRADCGNG